MAVGERGFIEVDTQLRTNVPHIFAIGDIVGQPMLAHKAVHEAHVAAEAAAGQKRHFDARVIPAVAYTDPEVAWVGITEDEAKAKGINLGKSVFPWVASGRAVANGRDEGFTKLLFDPETHRILGGGIVGTHAGDMIGELALAIEMGADAADIGHTIHPHPTLGESIGMAAEVFEGVCTDLPPQKKRVLWSSGNVLRCEGLESFHRETGRQREGADGLSRLPRRLRVFLPPLAMQQRLVIMELWPANAQIEAEAPGGWRLEECLHRLRVDNRQHAHAQPVRTGCQIQILDGHGRTLFQRLRHAVAAQTMTGSRIRFGEHRQLQRRCLQTMQLQLLVLGLARAGLGCQGLRIGSVVQGLHCLPQAGILYPKHAPRPGIAHRRRQRHGLLQRIQQGLGYRICPEVPHIAPPAQQAL